MGIFRDYLNEARDKSVPAEFRIAIGQLKRMYNAGETPDKKELEKDAEMIAKKNKLDCDKFTEFALTQFKLNEALSKSEYKSKKEELIDLLWQYDEGHGFDKKEDIYKQYKHEIDTIMLGKIKLDRALELLGFKKEKANDKLVKPIYDFLKTNLNESAEYSIQDILAEAKKVFDKNATPEEKANAIMSRCKKFRADSDVGYLLDDADIIQGIKDATKWEWKESEKYFKDNYKSIKINESAVGAPGRTTVKDAEDHIDDELVAEFKKIIKKIGGKTVAKVLLDKLGQKPEIKDEIEHIEDIIDNSNY